MAVDVIAVSGNPEDRQLQYSKPLKGKDRDGCVTYERDEETVDSCERHRGKLLAEELGAGVHAVDRSEDAEQQGAEHPAHAVDAPDIERVVPVAPLAEFDAEVAEDRRHEADDRGGPGLDKAGGGGDRGEARNRANAEADHAGLAEPVPLDANPHDERNRGTDLGVDRGVRSELVGVQRRTGTGKGGRGRWHVGCGAGNKWVSLCRESTRPRSVRAPLVVILCNMPEAALLESEPAKPEERGSEGNHWDAAGLVQGLLALAIGGLPVADNENASERSKPGRGVHNDAAGKVPDAPDAHPAVRPPDPVADRAVDEEQPKPPAGSDDDNYFISQARKRVYASFDA